MVKNEENCVFIKTASECNENVWEQMNRYFLVISPHLSLVCAGNSWSSLLDPCSIASHTEWIMEIQAPVFVYVPIALVHNSDDYAHNPKRRAPGIVIVVASQNR